MESEEPGGAAALPWTDSGWPDARGIPAADSAAAVAALYQNHAVGLIRLAYLMLGDRAGAEDAVLGREERQEVMRAVQWLPGRQRAAARLQWPP
jgi:DNA-directed RNA polymerase specialized sigma24 family protein